MVTGAAWVVVCCSVVVELDGGPWVVDVVSLAAGVLTVLWVQAGRIARRAIARQGTMSFFMDGWVWEDDSFL